MNPRICGCVLAVALVALVSACAWDRDTLAEEARGGSLETIKVIVGRFERNPPLYYEMRLERVTKELAANPAQLNLYDDAGVAADRLGKHTEAIEWMRKKSVAMQAGEPTKEDRYRYEANLGTFYAHRYGKSKDAKDLDSGITHIERALEINPDAHFGRERVQLEILKWLKEIPTSEPGLAEYLRGQGLYMKEQVAGTIEGLSGLIRLGVAWESIDTFSALAHALGMDRQGTTAQAAIQRIKELEANGKKALVSPKEGFEAVPRLPFGAERAQAQSEFKRLRQEAEAWHRARTEFMLSRLQAGKHPDTDPEFWAGYRESEVRINDLAFWRRRSLMSFGPMILASVAGLALLGAVGLATARALRRRRRAPAGI